MTISLANVASIISMTGETITMNTYSVETTGGAYDCMSYSTTTGISLTAKIREVTGREEELAEGYYQRGDWWLYIAGSYTIDDDYDFTISSTKYKIIDHYRHNYAGTEIYHKLLVRRMDY